MAGLEDLEFVVVELGNELIDSRIFVDAIPILVEDEGLAGSAISEGGERSGLEVIRDMLSDKRQRHVPVAHDYLHNGEG
jgi:hypothetical protein